MYAVRHPPSGTCIWPQSPRPSLVWVRCHRYEYGRRQQRQRGRGGQEQDGPWRVSECTRERKGASWEKKGTDDDENDLDERDGDNPIATDVSGLYMNGGLAREAAPQHT